MRIAAAQIRVDSDHEANTARIVKAIEETDSDAICFPETCINPDNTRRIDVSSSLRTITRAARAKRINAIVGSYVHEHKKILNRAWAIGRDGSIIHQYDKRHPFRDERGVTPGTTNSVFAFDDVPCGLIICYDYAFASDIKDLARRGALVIFAPSYLVSFPTTEPMLERIAQVRAFDAMACYVQSDAFAEDSFKQTRICTPFREEARLIGEEGVIVADIDIDALRRLRADARHLD